MKRHNLLKHLLSVVGQSTDFHVLCVLIVVQCIRLYRKIQHAERRQRFAAHWIGERRRPLRPIHIMPGILIAQLINLIIVFQSSPDQMIYQLFFGTLTIASISILPSVGHFTTLFKE